MPATHVYVCALDALFETDGEGVRFPPAPAPSPDAIAAVQTAIRQRILSAFQRRGWLERADHPELEEWHRGGGFSLDASVAISGGDRRGRERLLPGNPDAGAVIDPAGEPGGIDPLVQPEPESIFDQRISGSNTAGGVDGTVLPSAGAGSGSRSSKTRSGGNHGRQMAFTGELQRSGQAPWWVDHLYTPAAPKRATICGTIRHALAT
jgi:hypothetical protein